MSFSYSNSNKTTIIKKLCKSKKLVKSQIGIAEKPFAGHMWSAKSFSACDHKNSERFWPYCTLIIYIDTSRIFSLFISATPSYANMFLSRVQHCAKIISNFIWFCGLHQTIIVICAIMYGPLLLDRSVCLPLFAMWPSFGYFSTVI